MNWPSTRYRIPVKKPALCFFAVDKRRLRLSLLVLSEKYQEKQFPPWAGRRAHSVSWEMTYNEFSDLNATVGVGEKMRNLHYQRLPPSNIILS